MEKPFQFFFEGRAWQADIHISLETDGCYIFTILKDGELIERFGSDIDFKTDCENVLTQSTHNSKLHLLETAILESAKSLPQFLLQSQQLKEKKASS